METLAQYDKCLASCVDLFERKTQDYGTAAHFASVLVDRPNLHQGQPHPHLQEVGESKVGEGIEPEFIGIVNYCFMAMIQCDLDGSAPLELPVDEANRLYHAAKDAPAT